MSAASSACDHVRDWLLGTAPGTWVSMGVYSDGSYGQPAGLVYSYPVTCQGGKWEIVQGLEIDPKSAEKMRVSAEELSEERELALECIKESSA
jgi:malate dehydrogenase